MEVVLTYSLRERVDFVCTSVFTHMLLLSYSLCYTRPHTHVQTVVIVSTGGILEGSSFCVLITVGGIAGNVADSQLQGPRFHPEVGLLCIRLYSICMYFLCGWCFFQIVMFPPTL